MVGHALGSRLFASPTAELVSEAATRSGQHPPMLPVILGLLGALLFGAMVLFVRCTTRGRRSRSVPSWLFVALPVAAWPVQEALERLVHAEGFGLHAALDPSLLLGMALQIPFGIAAFLLARLLLGALVKACAVLSGRAPRLRRTSTAALVSEPILGAPRTRVAALRRSQRAPPRLLHS